VVAEPPCQPLTPRRATWLVLQRETTRTEAETQQLAQLHAQHPEVAEAIDLAQGFVTLVRQRQPEALDPWLKRATISTLEPLQRFATGLSEDYHAVKAGVTLPWSNGPVEGHINRLKMLKRQMCTGVDDTYGCSACLSCKDVRSIPGFSLHHQNGTRTFAWHERFTRHGHNIRPSVHGSSVVIGERGTAHGEGALDSTSSWRGMTCRA
jgi:hypothetical protein